MTDEYTCAVWYDRYARTEYELCAEEDEAASFAYWTNERGEGSVLGVQFADGRVVKCADWQALKDREREVDYIAPSDPTPPRPTRTVRDPFEGSGPVTVFADEPSWLGVQ